MRGPRVGEPFDSTLGVPISDELVALVDALQGHKHVHRTGNAKLVSIMRPKRGRSSGGRSLQGLTEFEICTDYYVSVDGGEPTYAGTACHDYYEFTLDYYFGGSGGDGGGDGASTTPFTGPATIYGQLSGVNCGSKDAAAKAALNNIYPAATNQGKGFDPGVSGREYGAVIASGPDGGFYYTQGFNSGSPDSINFGPGTIQSNLPAGYTAIGWVHIHPALFMSDADAVDPQTGTHFSQADELFSFGQQLTGYVAIGGTFDYFSWTPDQMNLNYKAPDKALGSVGAGTISC